MTSNSSSADVDVLVLIATQSFTGETLVEEILLDKLQDFLTVEVKLVDEVFDESIPQQQDEVISFWPRVATLFVVSTFGDGDPPNHAQGFADWLLSHKKAACGDDEGVPYAVFGLGDSTYANYCAFGTFVDQHMARLAGAQRLLPLATGDKQQDQSGAFVKWCDSVTRVLQSSRDSRVSSSSSKRLQKSPFTSGTGFDFRRSAIQQGSVVAHVSSVEELITSTTPGRSVVHVTLSLPTQLVPNKLQPGDHVGVYPQNDPSVVHRALQWLGVEPDTPTQVREATGLRQVSAFQLLSTHVDVAGRATPAILRSFIPFIGTLELRALARDLTQVVETTTSTETAFDEWVAERRLSALDLAVMFQCRPSLQAFARACGPMQPRLYSIVSVFQEQGANNTSKVGFCVAVVEGGLCSRYMAARRGQLDEPDSTNSSELVVFFRQTSFHLTATAGAPTILVAAGAGVGTCLGFVEQELERMKSENMVSQDCLSNIHLFFGCRTPAELLYREKLSALVNYGLRLYTAFSRVPGHPKTYVQDLIRREVPTVWTAVFTNGAKVYVCGRLELLAGVRGALIDVATGEGGLSKEAAQQAVSALDGSGQLMTDCWSVESPQVHVLDQRHSGRHPARPHIVLRLERHHDRHPFTKSESTDLSPIPDWPSYLRLVASGELERRVQRAEDMWSACVACGRNCETDRLSSDPKDWGECRVGEKAIVSSAFPHFGEERCLVGSKGSGTIFFGACNLKCMYCQNWELSAMDEGDVVSDERLANMMLGLQKRGCHNINFVSPTHNLLAILRAVLIAAKKGLRLPLVWNTGGYDSVVAIRLLEDVVDIYMPDSKYASRAVGRKLSKVDNYPEINEAAIKEMHRQVGELQIDTRSGLAKRGVLVRHLILPCELAGTCDVMSFLAKEVSADTYANVMDQYRPEHLAVGDKKFGLARRPTSGHRRRPQDLKFEV